MRIGFLGAGKMAQALAQGFIAAGISKPDRIIAGCPAQDVKYAEQIAAFGVRTTHDNAEVVKNCEVLVIGVKPPVVPKVLTEVAFLVEPHQHLVISIALGIPIRYLEQMLPRKSRVVRVMPNTPALVKEGASVFARGTQATEKDSATANRLFSSVGLCEEVPEVLIDACTGLSGGGPAYMYMAIEALADGGVKMGIPRDLAIRLAAQSLAGAAKMVLETGRHPGALKDDVCSPAGSTIQGVHKLEALGLRSTLIAAVEAATIRSKETGLRETK